MKILLTGCAGFIGFHTSKKLLDRGDKVIGIDNLNNYYDVNLKRKRLRILNKYKNFKFNKINLANKKKLDNFFKKNKFKYIIHLAAQAGVRYSLKKPETYIESNILGFFNLIENCKKIKIKRLIYASTSSVYGDQKKFPVKENYNTDSPLQLYAATKKSNELMAHAYSKLYGIQVLGLRFFTVYGPWGRPDMALFKFVSNILNNKKIQIYNYGKHERDFTFVDDIVEIIVRLIDSRKIKKKFEIFNIGNNKPVKLKDYILQIEKLLKKKARKKYMPLQPGDTIRTHANSTKVFKIVNFKPQENFKKGVKKFIDWYLNYYKHGIRRN